MLGSHSYFAYGSNLDVTQMARRCPDATDPRPATLADHDWLINERGVATVEPFDGAQVHGVLWQVSDHDLATLDSAEGVPVRYRRDRMTVHTDDGPAEAWVYVDHRVEPGPRGRATWSGSSTARSTTGCRPAGSSSSTAGIRRLAATPTANRIRLRHSHFRSCSPTPTSSRTSTLRSRFGFLAIHGGGLEKMTDVIAERAAVAADASVYVVRHPAHYPHHLSSAPIAPGSPPGSPPSSTTSTSWCRCTATAASAAARSCWRAAATARWPRTWPRTSRCPATRWSPIWTPSPANCAACTRTTR